jgi:hypothetical protein
VSCLALGIDTPLRVCSISRAVGVQPKLWRKATPDLAAQKKSGKKNHKKTQRLVMGIGALWIGLPAAQLSSRY